MAFKTIHTNFGLSAMAAAEASGLPIILTHMAVGDGNGNPTTPTPEQTGLVREMYRATVNRVYQDPADAFRFTAEFIVPATEGGFVLREVGVFDADGNLFAVGNLPDTYKPSQAEGAFSDCVIRMEFLVSNADVVTLQIDPNVAVATQTWIINNITAASIIPGGTTGQVLTKAANADGAYVWADPDDVNVIVSTVEEQQTLAAAQTEITWATVNNNGLAIYVEGVRIPRTAGVDGWQPHGSDPAKSILGKSYPAGTRVVGVQNEPASVMPDPLESSLNLSDVPSKAAARTNLDVYSKAEADQKAPAGAVVMFARSTAPSGWLKANGAAVSRTAYAALFAAIGTTYGAGDGFNTFNLPDLRGEFLRCWDDGRGVDVGRTLGSFQAEAFKSHQHIVTALGDAQAANRYLYGTASLGATQIATLDDKGANTSTAALTSAAGGAETRPRNRALLACIKF